MATDVLNDEWLGDPCNSTEVRLFLKSLRKEEKRTGRIPKQAPDIYSSDICKFEKEAVRSEHDVWYNFCLDLKDADPSTPEGQEYWKGENGKESLWALLNKQVVRAWSRAFIHDTRVCGLRADVPLLRPACPRTCTRTRARTCTMHMHMN